MGKRKRHTRWKKFLLWIDNLKGLPQRMMMRHLRKHNWVVFYLEPKDRLCDGNTCWLSLYKWQCENEEIAKKKKKHRFFG